MAYGQNLNSTYAQKYLHPALLSFKNHNQREFVAHRNRMAATGGGSARIVFYHANLVVAQRIYI